MLNYAKLSTVCCPVGIRVLDSVTVTVTGTVIGYLAHCSYSIHRAAGARHDSHRRGERRRQWTYWRDNNATDDLIKW